jgi:hypothetical protein
MSEPCSYVPIVWDEQASSCENVAIVMPQPSEYVLEVTNPPCHPTVCPS